MALKVLEKLGYQPASRVHVESVIEEECSGNGTLSCCKRGYLADACIIPEPFGDTIVTAQPGVMWFDCTVKGKPAHVLSTSSGVNAILAAFHIYQRLQKLEKEWNLPEQRHPSFPQDRFPHPINFNLVCSPKIKFFFCIFLIIKVCMFDRERSKEESGSLPWPPSAPLE